MPKHTTFKLRPLAKKIYKAALAAVDAEVAVRRSVRLHGDTLRVGHRRYALRRYTGVHVLGAGKAAAAMARGLERALGGHLQGGVVVVKYGHGEPLQRVQIMEAGHPEPDACGFAGAQALVDWACTRVTATDLVFFLLSGGASALIPLPCAGISLAEKIQLSAKLLKCGAGIQELNTIRKHVSQIKGGQLAKLLGETPTISLILSDVVGDDLSAIGSGPTVPDPTTFAESLAILRRYNVLAEIPDRIVRHMEAGAAGLAPETPKAGERFFENNQTEIIASNILACRAAAGAARRLGFAPIILSSSIVGDTQAVAEVHLAVVRDVIRYGHPIRPPACVISGGETTVRVFGDGLGGRNQQFVLHTIPGLSDWARNTLLVSLGTDGTDGPTDAAGAWADNRTLARASALGLPPVEDFLTRNDSYHFFQPLNDLIITGPTRTNVMDLRFVLIA
ncbi:MAG: glycerate kinase [Acidobacteria bacterium]|nr:glycerate kinase [Acidobacteriota bacterium]MBI3656384.1 glycerate kinase [Acidobacteriota bacterium]